MRIVHVTPHLPPDQAANALLPALAGEWAATRDHTVGYVAHPSSQVAVTSSGASSDEAAAPLAGPVTWIPRRGKATAIVRMFRLDALKLARQIGAVLDEVAAGADLLHLHSNGLIVEAASAWARRRGKPYLLTLYGTEIWHYRRRWPVDLFRRAYVGASGVTFYSRHLLERARELRLDRAELSVVYPAVADGFLPHDRETREAWRSELGIREPLVILNVKRLHELAGQTYLLDAFAALTRNRRDVRLVICGTGDLRGPLEAQARQLGIDDRVTFTGLVPNPEVARYMAAADVFALPSLLEALPTVAVEALASGTPVVSADHPGGLELREIFGDDVTVVPRRDVPALALALGEALATPRRTRPATGDRLTAQFRTPAIGAAYEAAYRRAVGHPMTHDPMTR